MGKLRVLPVICAVSVACVFALQGCGQKEQKLSLPEMESKQMEEKGPGAGLENVMAKGVKPASPTGEFKKFYVYADQGYFKNHFIPAGWMGDYGDVSLSDASTVTPQSRRTCIRVKYSAQRKQGAGWAGVYWQDPANNWGNIKGGFDLTGAKKLTFWARGEKGGEVVTEFKMGGITGEFSDSASGSVGPIVLTNEWRQYTIDLASEDLSLVIGGFAFIVSAMENPDGAIFYIDEIAYE